MYGMGSMIGTLEERLRSKFEADPDTGCWLWQASKYRDGYGRVWADGRGRLAHRVSYELFVGQIPEGLDIDHLCRVRHCVNPEHMEPVTRQVNGLRGVGPQAGHAAQTHCIRGHELTGDNVIIVEYTGRPARCCRACRREKHLEHYQPAPERSVLDRFMSKVRLVPSTGCWRWTASVSGNSGQFQLNGRHTTAPRAAWQLLRADDLNDGLDLVRTCSTDLCVNPEHHRPTPSSKRPPQDSLPPPAVVAALSAECTSATELAHKLNISIDRCYRLMQKCGVPPYAVGRPKRAA
jgi:hypothetical protein